MRLFVMGLSGRGRNNNEAFSHIYVHSRLKYEPCFICERMHCITWKSVLSNFLLVTALEDDLLFHLVLLCSNVFFFLTEEEYFFEVAEAVFVCWFTFEYVIRFIAAPQKLRFNPFPKI